VEKEEAERGGRGMEVGCSGGVRIGVREIEC
jgi:hypothetical protein